MVLEGEKLVVTYKLLKDVLWSDGKPFTCDDVLFTWEAVVDPDSGAVSTAGYDQITSIECPDETTAVVTYEPLYAPYLALFTDILPRHATGIPAEMQDLALQLEPGRHRPIQDGRVDTWSITSPWSRTRTTATILRNPISTSCLPCHPQPRGWAWP